MADVLSCTCISGQKCIDIASQARDSPSYLPAKGSCSLVCNRERRPTNPSNIIQLVWRSAGYLKPNSRFRIVRTRDCDHSAACMNKKRRQKWSEECWIAKTVEDEMWHHKACGRRLLHPPCQGGR